MDRSKKGPPEVPHHEGALADLWGTDFEGFWAVSCFFLGGGFLGGPLRLIFGAGLFFGAWDGLGTSPQKSARGEEAAADFFGLYSLFIFPRSKLWTARTRSM